MSVAQFVRAELFFWIRALTAILGTGSGTRRGTAGCARIRLGRRYFFARPMTRPALAGLGKGPCVAHRASRRSTTGFGHGAERREA